MRQAQVAHIILSLQEAYPENIKDGVKAGSILAEMVQMPQTKDRLQVHPRGIREPVPLMPVMKDESTVSNNIEILKQWHRVDLGLSDSFFDSRPVLPVGGDNKTCNRLWSAMYGAVGNTNIYDRLHHLLVIPGLFHAQMHVVSAIIKLYWGADPEPGQRVPHATLRYAAGKMGRKFVSPSNQIYAHARIFLRDNYQA